jgi:hypothetical protein
MNLIHRIKDFLFSKFYQVFFYSEALFFIAVAIMIAFLVLGR